MSRRLFSAGHSHERVSTSIDRPAVVGLGTSLTLLLALLLAACGGGNKTVIVAGPPPAWVDRLPKSPGKLCAVGYSGRTLYQQDCLGNAAENARGGLAETVSATIKTVTLDIADSRGGHFSRDVYVSVDESASEAILQGSEVESQWMDMLGQRGSPKGCYAMVCIDPSKPIDSMVSKMTEKKLPPKTVEKVRANAAAAFEDLEKLEAKHEAQKAPPPPPPAAENQEQPPAQESADGAAKAEQADAPKAEQPEENPADNTAAAPADQPAVEEKSE